MDDGQHSFLFRHDLRNKCAPHIYSGVGYRVVYCYLGLSTTFIQIDEIGSTLSFLVGGQIRLSKNPHRKAAYGRIETFFNKY